MGQVNVLTTFVLRLLWEDGDKATLASLVLKLLWEDGDKAMW